MKEIVITAKDGTGLTDDEVRAYLKKNYMYQNEVYTLVAFTAIDVYLNCEVSYKNGEFELGIYEDDES